MPGSPERVRCPRCGTPMNRHAEKLVYGSDAETSGGDMLGGVLEETHACPGCGNVLARRV